LNHLNLNRGKLLSSFAFNFNLRHYASELNRELLDREANQKLDASIQGYLRLLSGFFLAGA